MQDFYLLLFRKRGNILIIYYYRAQQLQSLRKTAVAYSALELKGEER